MKKKSLFSSLVLLLVIGATVLGFRSAAHSYAPSSDGTLTAVAIHPTDPSRHLIASQKGVYIQWKGRNWKRIYSLPDPSDFIHQLILQPNAGEKIFLVTEKGALEINLKTGKSKWIFQGSGAQRYRIRTMAIHHLDSNQIYLGTDGGLFISGDGGETWLRSFDWPENQPIQLIAFLPQNPSLFLLATNRELFFSKDGGKTFESGFSLPLPEQGLEDFGLPSDSEKDRVETDSTPRFSSIAFSTIDHRHLWIGTPEGVFESQDGGIVWQKLPDRGLNDHKIRDLVFSEHSGLIAASSRGVARFLPDQKRWEILPIGLIQSPAAITLEGISKENKETLLIATGNEVLKWDLNPIEISNSSPFFLPSPEQLELLRKLFEREPTIQDVQKAAIDYSGLGNGKIQRWQWGSRMRALIPRLSFGKDFSLGNNIDIDRGSTNNPDVFIEGPETMDKGWNLGLTWELGDFLYSTAQTSIDSRAKLLVELRESILSQVTRIYFERRRVQMEIAFSGGKTQQEYFDFLLRLDELTAQIDALTDGFLSKKLEALYEQEPELKDIWNAAMVGLTT